MLLKTICENSLSSFLNHQCKNVVLHFPVGVLMGYIFDNVTTNATRAKGCIWLFASSCIIMLEYWQFQWCNGNHNWSEVNANSNYFSQIYFAFAIIIMHILLSLYSAHVHTICDTKHFNNTTRKKLQQQPRADNKIKSFLYDSNERFLLLPLFILFPLLL